MLPKRLLVLTFFAAFVVMPTCGLHAQWVQTSEPGGNILGLTGNDRILFADSYELKGLFRSQDNGRSWVECDSGLPSEIVNTSETYGKILLKDTNLFLEINSNRIYCSIDAGTGWSEASDGLDSVFLIHDLKATARGLCIATNSGIYISTDNGLIWTPGTLRAETYTLATIGHTIFTTDGNVVSLSTDDGANWTSTNSQGIHGKGIWLLGMLGSYLFASTDSGIFRSLDSGNHWNDLNYSIAEYPHNFFNTKVIYLLQLEQVFFYRMILE